MRLIAEGATPSMPRHDASKKHLEVPRAVRELAEWCLQGAYERRPTADEAVNALRNVDHTDAGGEAAGTKEEDKVASAKKAALVKFETRYGPEKISLPETSEVPKILGRGAFGEASSSH